MTSNFAVVILNFAAYVVGLYQMVVIVSVIFSWLIGFNVINGRNDFVRALWTGLLAVTEPLLGPIRRLLPNMGGLDISPIILLLACMLLQNVIIEVLVPAVRGV